MNKGIISYYSSNYISIQSDYISIELYTLYDVSGIIRLLKNSIVSSIFPIIDNTYFVSCVTKDNNMFVGFVRKKSVQSITENEIINSLLTEKTLVPERVSNYVMNYIQTYDLYKSNNPVVSVQLLKYLPFEEEIEHQNFHTYKYRKISEIRKIYNHLFGVTYYRVTGVTVNGRVITTNVNEDEIYDFVSIFKEHNKAKVIINATIQIDDYFVNFFITNNKKEFPVFDKRINPSKIYKTKNFSIGNKIIIDDVILDGEDSHNLNREVLKLLNLINVMF